MTQPGPGAPAHYHSYLLRLWREGPRGEWRASLESTATGKRHMFADMKSLFAFLEAEAHGAAAEPPARAMQKQRRSVGPIAGGRKDRPNSKTEE